MEKTYTYKKQGNGTDSWVCTEMDGGEIIDVYMVYEKPLIWPDLRSALFTCAAFKRLILHPELANNIAYGALQTILSTEGKEGDLLQMLQLTMTYTDSEKEEINQILETNNFTIRL